MSIRKPFLFGVPSTWRVGCHCYVWIPDSKNADLGHVEYEGVTSIGGDGPFHVKTPKGSIFVFDESERTIVSPERRYLLTPVQLDDQVVRELGKGNGDDLFYYNVIPPVHCAATPENVFSRDNVTRALKSQHLEGEVALIASYKDTSHHFVYYNAGIIDQHTKFRLYLKSRHGNTRAPLDWDETSESSNEMDAFFLVAVPECRVMDDFKPITDVKKPFIFSSPAEWPSGAHCYTWIPDANGLGHIVHERIVVRRLMAPGEGCLLMTRPMTATERDRIAAGECNDMEWSDVIRPAQFGIVAPETINDRVYTFADGKITFIGIYRGMVDQRFSVIKQNSIRFFRFDGGGPVCTYFAYCPPLESDFKTITGVKKPFIFTCPVEWPSGAHCYTWTPDVDGLGHIVHDVVTRPRVLSADEGCLVMTLPMTKKERDAIAAGECDDMNLINTIRPMHFTAIPRGKIGDRVYTYYHGNTAFAGIIKEITADKIYSDQIHFTRRNEHGFCLVEPNGKTVYFATCPSSVPVVDFKPISDVKKPFIFHCPIEWPSGAHCYTWIPNESGLGHIVHDVVREYRYLAPGQGCLLMTRPMTEKERNRIAAGECDDMELSDVIRPTHFCAVITARHVGQRLYTNANGKVAFAGIIKEVDSERLVVSRPGRVAYFKFSDVTEKGPYFAVCAPQEDDDVPDLVGDFNETILCSSAEPDIAPDTVITRDKVSIGGVEVNLDSRLTAAKLLASTCAAAYTYAVDKLKLPGICKVSYTSDRVAKFVQQVMEHDGFTVLTSSDKGMYHLTIRAPFDE